MGNRIPLLNEIKPRLFGVSKGNQLGKIKLCSYIAPKWRIPEDKLLPN